MEIRVQKDGNHCLMSIDNGPTLIVKDYKILTRMNGYTELELKIEVQGDITEFVTSATRG